MIDYSAGFFSSLETGIYFAFAVFFLIGIEKRDFSLGIHLLFSMLVAVTAGMALSNLEYTLVNLWNHRHIKFVDFMILELRSGAIGLRLSSIMLGLHTISRVTGHVLSNHFKVVKRFVGQTKRGFEDMQELDDFMDADDIDWVIIAQNGIYLTVVTCLWVFSVEGRSTTSMLILSWSLFFIIDDWFILTTIMDGLRGRLLRTHRIRIGLFNLLLIGLLLKVAVFEFGTRVGFLITAVLCILLFWRYAPIALRTNDQVLQRQRIDS